MADMPETKETHTPEENGSRNDDTVDVSDTDIVLENVVEEYSQECTALNSTMEEIDTWMTSLEKQNDDLYSKIQDLLESNQQTRHELQKESNTAGSDKCFQQPDKT